MYPSKIIEKISSNPITYDEAFSLQTSILEGKLNDVELLRIFKALERGCNQDELTGFFDASKAKSELIKTDRDTLDVVGTGGDGFNTINISTIASFVIAAYGQAVAKHGNRAATSKCGSADVLESLGANIEIPRESVQNCLSESNFVFLFAPFYNDAFKYARSARKTYGKRTYFNILGPLLNPANPIFRLIGTSDIGQTENMLCILKHTGVKRAWIVSGVDGLDEISTAGETSICEYNEGKVSYFKIHPKDFGLETVPTEELKGGDVTTNAKVMKSILEGKDNSSRVLAVIMNAAAGLVISGKCDSMKEGIQVATNILKEGTAIKNLDNFIKASKLH